MQRRAVVPDRGRGARIRHDEVERRRAPHALARTTLEGGGKRAGVAPVEGDGGGGGRAAAGPPMAATAPAAAAHAAATRPSAAMACRSEHPAPPRRGRPKVAVSVTGPRLPTWPPSNRRALPMTGAPDRATPLHGLGWNALIASSPSLPSAPFGSSVESRVGAAGLRMDAAQSGFLAPPSGRGSGTWAASGTLARASGGGRVAWRSCRTCCARCG